MQLLFFFRRKKENAAEVVRVLSRNSLAYVALPLCHVVPGTHGFARVLSGRADVVGEPPARSTLQQWLGRTPRAGGWKSASKEPQRKRCPGLICAAGVDLWGSSLWTSDCSCQEGGWSPAPESHQGAGGRAVRRVEKHNFSLRGSTR